MLTLQEFQSWCATQEILNVHDVRSATIKSYLLYCQKEKGNNPTTRNSKLHTLKIFFNYLESIEVIESKQNPIKGMQYVKEDIQISTFSDHHIRQMLNYYRRIKDRTRSFQAYRNHTMIIFLLGTGARLGEMINLKWSDVDLVNGSITVYGKKRIQSSIPITQKLVKELAEYKIFCEQHFKQLSEYVFVSKKNNQLAVDTVKNIFKHLKNVMGFKDVRLSAHTFRHTFAKRYLMNGGDLFSLQRMLRHSQISMTQRYVNLFGTELRELNNRHNPLNELDI
jgi:integrase/recombinase XerD